MADDPQSPAAQQRMMRKVYYRDPKIHPAAVEMYQVDANIAVTQHPDEWSYEPWGSEEAHPMADVYLPAEWRDLSTQKRRALAMSLGAPATVKANEADDFIAAEAERREGVQAAEVERQEQQAQDDRQRAVDDKQRARERVNEPVADEPEVKRPGFKK